MTCCCCKTAPAVLFGRYCSACFWATPVDKLNEAYWGQRYALQRSARAEMDHARKQADAHPQPFGGTGRA